MKNKPTSSIDETTSYFLAGKSDHSVALFHHFIEQCEQIGKITIHPTKTMIGIAASRKRIAYITQLGNDFIHVVIPFEKPLLGNLCFQKIVQVPGDAKQFNHHFRMYAIEDVNEEVRGYMKLAYTWGS